MLDFVRIACAVPAVKVGDVKKNAADICAYMEKADAQNVDIIVFPELALTGYTCGDLFFQDALHNGVKAGLREILECSKAHPQVTAVVGMPLRIGAKLYNCAAVISGGEVRGIVPKTHIPGNEKRWFSAGGEADRCVDSRNFGPEKAEGVEWIAYVRAEQYFTDGNISFGVEVCEDLMAPVSPSAKLAMNGAEIILNLSASPETVGKRAYRRDLVKMQSAACNCVYVYCSAGCTESTSDTVFGGHCIMAENGKILAENQEQIATDYMLVQDFDLGRIKADRIRKPYYSCGEPTQEYLVGTGSFRSDGSLYPLRKLPFVPSKKEDRLARCMEIFNIQVAGLKQRLSVINAKPVIGISGGLDSTLALLVAAEAVRQMGKPMTDIHGITMPCFGTSDRTYNNSWDLMKKLGITAHEINIKKAVTQHFEDIGHDSSVHNGTYENSQARERTQILMDYAGMVGGIVVGTGDLSELALGWCTYNGDHMSMYGVNGSIPKTLIRWIIEAVAEMPTFAPAKAVLMDVLDTPISPELLPPDAEGKISQQTEDLVGPYALHDFFLFYALRYGYTPTRIYALACRAFAGDFDSETVKKWLKSFYRRFFTQQFKRNCQPDGVRLGSVSLSPGQGWQMPSDASARLWLEEAEGL